MPNRKEMWDELNRAINKKFKNGKTISEDIKVDMMRFEFDNKNVLSLIPYGIDNGYGEDWHWEIYLYEDGTWTIE